ncbi:dipeptidase PepV [Sporolactobacillus shoreicorticis]|uniref:Dipeptidase PepV n=1 Tax=Sporolactobacillus shoreicorticis TaxID=1923877 RepID=A0ABW5SB61_9BACL|nr:dipeptidase PepV [Sporolactobacillus shoreicorticis]MCO7126917.1 dipeptidase PepV [Sporolactobacillus shoreicorticis]
MSQVNVKSNKDAFLEDLSALISIPSTKDASQAKEGAPFGPGPLAALEKILEMGDRDGFRTKMLQGYAGYIEYGPEDAEDYIAVLGHVDVVPATGKWAHDPFTAHVENGTLYARGAIDDKGPTMAAYYALKALKESGAPIKNRIRLVIGTDEESGCACMQKYNELEPMSLFGFAPDAEFPLIFAEKGQIRAWIKLPQTVGDAPVHISSFYSGERINMVPDHAYAILAGTEAEKWSAHAQAELKAKKVPLTVENTEQGIKLTVKGQSAHGSEPAGGVNAAFLLAAALKELPLIPTEQAFIDLLADTLTNDFGGERLGIKYHDDVSGELTVNVGVIRFGEAGGTVSLDIRCPIKASLDELTKTLTASVEKLGLSIGELGTSKPLYMDPKHPAVQILKNVYEKHMGLKNVELLTSGGGTYAQYLDAGVAFGACMPGYPYTGHQVDEHVKVDDLLLASEIYADAMAELGNLEK